jgi:superfamily II DNA or RNA helicase
MIDPRSYQVAGRDLLRAAFADGNRRVVGVAPTGAGKTILFCKIVLGHIAKPGRRVLAVVHRRELIKQTVRKMREAGIERVGVIAAGWASDPDALVQVPSVQTLLAREQRPEGVTLIVLDEAHHYVAETWGTIVASYPDAKIIGVTATPERGDGTPLGDLFEALVPIVSVGELTRLGFLVPCEVIAPPKRLRHNAQSPLDAYTKHAPGRQAVVFASSVEEAHALAQEFSAAGFPAACVEADTPAANRDSILERFERGELRVLCNVFVLTEGWDCPSVEVCILARGCSATGTYLQMVGRVLRPAPGKSSALLIDLRGAVHEHGLPEEDRAFSLEGRAISGGDAPVKTCPECERTIPLPARTCPNCGTAQAGAMRGEPIERHELTRAQRREQERGDFVEQLEAARQRGYKPGWAAHRFVERYGRFPAALWRELVGRRAA